MLTVFNGFGIAIVGTIILALGIGGCNAATYKILPKFSKTSVAGMCINILYCAALALLQCLTKIFDNV